MSSNDEKPMKKKKTEPTEGKKQALVAKKDFHLVHNEINRKIKTGDDLSDIPEHYHANLKTEGVL